MSTHSHTGYICMSLHFQMSHQMKEAGCWGLRWQIGWPTPYWLDATGCDPLSWSSKITTWLWACTHWTKSPTSALHFYLSAYHLVSSSPFPVYKNVPLKQLWSYFLRSVGYQGHLSVSVAIFLVNKVKSIYWPLIKISAKLHQNIWQEWCRVQVLFKIHRELNKNSLHKC